MKSAVNHPYQATWSLEDCCREQAPHHTTSSSGLALNWFCQAPNSMPTGAQCLANHQAFILVLVYTHDGHICPGHNDTS
jgi:hypothetical protein